MTIYTSSYSDLDIPQVDLLSLLFDSEWCLAREKDVIHADAANPDTRVTKAEARIWTKRIAYDLRIKYGVGAEVSRENHVMVSIKGSPMAPILFYGLVAAGGIYCGASTDSQVPEIVHQIQESKSRLIICSPECVEQFAEAAKRCNIPADRVLILDAKAWTLRSSNEETSQISNSTLDWEPITGPHTLSSTTICLLYSSGTTGLPKGVRLSHANLVAIAVSTMAVARRYKARSARARRHFSYDTIAHLPMSNIAGITLYATNPFYMGGTTYWMPDYTFDLFLKYHRQFRPSYQFSVPPIWLRIAKSSEVTDHFDHLQVAVTGSAPIGFATVREVQRKLGKGNCHMAQTWGATECAGTITTLEWPTYVEQGKWAVGEPPPGTSIRFVNEDDKDVPPGEPGELLVSGPIVAQGYHNRPEATRDTFVDGWYRTGDIGAMKDNLITIVDRKKELIKYKGAQVAPAELEALLTSHPKVADAAVIGIWDKERETEVPRGYVVVQNGVGEVKEEEIQGFVMGKVASHKYLRGGIVFVREIPKSASGKILRKELRAKAGRIERGPKI